MTSHGCGTSTKHVWATPDPDEIEPGCGGIICGELHPWSPEQGGRTVFHIDNRLDGFDYVCTACGVRTNRGRPGVTPRWQGTPEREGDG